VQKGDLVELPAEFDIKPIYVADHTINGQSGSLLGYSENGSFILTYTKGKITSNIVHKLNGQVFIIRENINGYSIEETEHDDEGTSCGLGHFEDWESFDDDPDANQAMKGTAEGAQGGASTAQGANGAQGANMLSSLPESESGVRSLIDVQIGFDDEQYDYLIYNARLKSLVNILNDYDNLGGITGCPEYNGLDPNNYFDQYAIDDMIDACNQWSVDIMDNSIQTRDIIENWLTSWSAQSNEGFTNSLVESVRLNFINLYRVDPQIYQDALDALTLTGDERREYIQFDLAIEALYDYAPLLNRMNQIGADLHVQVTSTLGISNNGGRGTFPKWGRYGGPRMEESRNNSYILKTPVDLRSWKSNAIYIIKSNTARDPLVQLYPGENSQNYVQPFRIFSSGSASSTLIVGSTAHPVLNWTYILENCGRFGGVLQNNYSTDGDEIDSCFINYNVYDLAGNYIDPSVELLKNSSVQSALLMHEFGHNLGLRHGRTHAETDSLFMDLDGDGVMERTAFKNPFKDNEGRGSIQADVFSQNESNAVANNDFRIIGNRSNLGMAACAQLGRSTLRQSYDHPNPNVTWYDDESPVNRYINPIHQEFAGNHCYSTIMHYEQGTTKARNYSSSRIFIRNANHSMGTPDLDKNNWSIVRVPIEGNESFMTYSLSLSEWQSVQRGTIVGSTTWENYIPTGIPSLVDATPSLMLYASWLSDYRERKPSQAYDASFDLPDVEMPEIRSTDCGEFLYTGILERIALPCNFFEAIAQFVHPSKLVSYRFPYRNVSNVMQEVAVRMTPVQKAQMSKTVMGDGDNITALYTFDEDTLALDPMLETSSGWTAYTKGGMELSTKFSSSEKTSLKINPAADTTKVQTPFFIDFDEGKIDIAFEMLFDVDSEKGIDKYAVMFEDVESHVIAGVRADYGVLAFYDPSTGDDYYTSTSFTPSKFHSIGIVYDPMEQTLSYSFDGKVVYVVENVESFMPLQGKITAYDFGGGSALHIDDFRMYRNQYSAVADLIPTRFVLEPGQTQMVEIKLDPSLLDTDNVSAYRLTTNLDGVDILETDFEFAKSSSDVLDAPVLTAPEDSQGKVSISPTLTWEHKPGSDSFTGYKVMVAKRSSDESFASGNTFVPLPQFLVMEDTVKDLGYVVPEKTLSQGTEYIWQVTPIYYGNMSGTSSATATFTTQASEIGALTLKVDSVYTIPGKPHTIQLYASEKLPGGISAFEVSLLMPASVDITGVTSALEDSVMLEYTIGNSFNPATSSLIPGSTMTLQDAGYSVNELSAYGSSYKVLKIAMSAGKEFSSAGPLVDIRVRFDDAGTYRIFPFSGLFNTDAIGSYDFEGVLIEEQLLGDLDRNGKIQAFDAAAILHYLVESDLLDNFPWDWKLLKAADYNNDGQIRAVDAGRILQSVAKQKSVASGGATSDSLSISANFENGVLTIANGSGNLYGLELSIGSAELLEIGDVLSGYVYASNIVNDTLKVAIAAAETMQEEIVTIELTPGENEIPLTVIANVTKDSVVVTGQTGTSVGPDSELPREFALYPNYPNPFNPTTVISFDLPKVTGVTLEVYNVMGQRVMTLMQNQTTQAGRHSVTLDASGLASGLYMYKLSAGEFQQVRSMMLIR